MSRVVTELEQQWALRASCAHPTGQWEAFPYAAVGGSLVARFEAVVARLPAQVAIETEQDLLTYAQLNQVVNRIAHCLLVHCGSDEAPVALLTQQRLSFVVGSLGLLKAGKICAPLDLAYLPSRLAQRLQEAKIRVIVCDQAALEQVTVIQRADLSAHGIELISLEQAADWPAADNPELVIAPERLAWMFYTSGSTATAKSVVQNHRNLLYEIYRHTNAFRVCAADRLAFIAPTNVIGGMREIFLALLNGATLCPFTIKEHGLKSFCVWLAEKEITICRLIPTLLRNLPTVHHPGVHFPTIRLLYVGGEVVTSRDVALFQQLFSPTALFVHVFGASETGIFRTYYLSAQTATVPAILPVGYALDDTEVWIADDAGQPLGVNEIGEIMVESRYLALGYWQNPTLTATVFLPSTTNPDRRLCRTGDLGCLRSDGCLEFHGRKDQQVKVRGYRVEIGIIEATLARLPEVKACTVTFDISTGEEYLCAYLVLYPSQQFDTRTVRAHLRESLPEYMMPTAFVLLDELPTLPNGKVDRYALPKPLEPAMQDSTTVTAPRTSTEQRLLVIWSALLGLEQIDIHVNFFELGGHSLLMMRLLVQVEEQFQQPVELHHFILNPTIANLAALLDNAQTKAEASTLGQVEPVWPTLPTPASPEQTELHTINIQALYEKITEQNSFQQSSPLILSTAHAHVLRLLHRPAMQLLARVVQSHWVQAHYLPRQTVIVQQFLGNLEDLPTQQNLLERCLFYGFLMHFHLQRYLFAPLQHIGRIIVNGSDHLDRARAIQQGVILLSSHNYQLPYLRTLALSQGVIGGIERVVRSLDVDREAVKQILYSHQLAFARQTLSQGGVIRISPDVNRGRGNSITVPFHGHQHEFRTGFAELAILTDAQIFFVSSDLHSYDRFCFELVGPFDMGTPSMPYADRVQHLMDQYVSHLRQEWARNPWALPWWLMREHLSYPSA